MTKIYASVQECSNGGLIT